jgi:membrane protein YdbS with pleckstrin-like domain
MTCKQCGAEVPAQAAFCPQCGARQTTADSTADSGPAVRAAQRLTGARPAAAGNQPAEQELWSGTYSPKAMIGPAIGATLLTVLGLVAVVLSGGSPTTWMVLGIGALLVWGVLGLATLYRRLSVRYQLTTYRLFHEKGLLSRTRDRIEVIDIDDVTLTQGLIERMLDLGTIHIISSDESLKREKERTAGDSGGAIRDSDFQMPGIEDARRIADLIDNTRRTERNRRGVFLENV